MSFFNPVYKSFEPPAACSNPKELKKFIFDEIYTDSYCTKTYLKGYQPKKDTLGKQKAKEYWSSNLIENGLYEKKQNYFEKIRQDYPNEVEKLRKKIWKKHVVVMAENDLRFWYLRKNTSPEMPDDFIDLESYQKVESVDGIVMMNHWDHFKSTDFRSTKTVIEQFPEASKEIKWAKKYILGQLSAEERENIPEKYLPQVKRFRVLLWERHLECIKMKKHNEKEREGIRKEVKVMQEEFTRKSNQKFFIVATIIVATLAGFFLSRCGRRSLNFPTFKSLIGVPFFKSMTSLSEGIPKSLEPNGNAFCTCGGGHFYCCVENAKPHIKQAKL